MVTACLGDSNSDTVIGGDLGQPCLENGTCNHGLLCTIVNGKAQCQPPGDASTEGGAGSCGLAITVPMSSCPGKIACYQGTAAATCVTSDTDCVTDAGQNVGAHACLSEKDCGMGDVCCLQDGANLATKLCPGTLDLNSSPSSCGATLPTGSGACANGNSPGDLGDAILCSSNAGCPQGMTCYPVRLSSPMPLQGQIFGVCI